MDIRIKIGLRIKELRKNLSLTQEALAFKADLDKTYVNEVENGKRNISVVNLEKVILALDTDIKDFFQATQFSSTN
ncbi:helix-turn-helix transcriptional regulator [Sphingobacterium faecium]|uniref:helix-turn-helix domain-containing protein n=1 Tax=Sphingobacterium faecium TaxID=34087 RepID=UPI0021B4F706|nr:helix-turn-helix transcriptional regulator [Sphingobacterium faecium]UXD71388.1 helix-turn-helix transcriptional regulator [Sphingobacterium faecium]